MKNKAMPLIILFAMMILVQGCGKAEKYGEIGADRETTEIVDILANPDSFNGKTVKITGKITTECPSGCWFDAGEESRVIRVDIAPAGLAIPQRVGKTVIVEGKISVKDKNIKLFGKGVEIK